MRACEIGGRIRRARLARGITQVELAQRLSTSQSWVSSLESGKIIDPHLSTLFRVAFALDISPEFLITDDPSGEI